MLCCESRVTAEKWLSQFMSTVIENEFYEFSLNLLVNKGHYSCQSYFL